MQWGMRMPAAHAQPHKRQANKPAPTLKQEQFALVNAQTKLNSMTRKRRVVENKLAKKLRVKEKTAVETQRLEMKADEKKFQTDANAALKDTTKIDKFLVKDRKESKDEHAKLEAMKKTADEGVHDEFIASTSAMKTMDRFNQLIGQAAGLTQNLHTPSLRKAMANAGKLGSDEGGNKNVDPAKDIEHPKQAENKQAEQKMNNKAVKQRAENKKEAAATEKKRVDKFVKVNEGHSGTHIDDTQVQPTKEKAIKALHQMKRDEKVAGAYGKKLEAREEKKVGTKMPDEKGNGVIQTPPLNNMAQNNPESRP